MALMEKAEAFAVKATLEYLDRNPEKNLPKLMDWFDKFDRKGTLEKERGGLSGTYWRIRKATGISL